MSAASRATARALLLRFGMPAFGLCALAAFAILYVEDIHVYRTLLIWSGIVPFRYPFLDFQYILAGAECWQRGIDVYIADPCDVLNRGHGYSPLWLRLPWPGPALWTNPLGLALAIAFILSLLCLPAPKSGKELVIGLLAMSSTMVLFAVERANVDVIMFLLAIAAATLLLRVSWRKFFGYSLILLAGLLKFYPIVLLVLSLRERLRTCLVVNALALTVLVGFVVDFHGELAAMARNIPAGSNFSDMFGAVNLPWGIEQLVFAPREVPSEARALLVRQGLSLVLMLAFIVGVAWQSLRMATSDIRLAVRSLPERDALFLIAGAAMIGGCFFAGRSTEYRGIHFLLILPGLLSLSRNATRHQDRALFARIVVMIVYLMWGGFFRHIAEAWRLGDAVQLVLWLLREWLWWQVIAVLCGILLCFVCETAAVRQFRDRLRVLTYQ